MEKIGWIGTCHGEVHVPACPEEGLDVSVHNQTKERRHLCRQGAAGSTPGGRAAQSDIIFTMVGEPADVEQSSGGGGIWNASARRRHRGYDTSSHPWPQRIYKEAKGKSVSSLDAPVSGVM